MHKEIPIPFSIPPPPPPPPPPPFTDEEEDPFETVAVYNIVLIRFYGR